jgi:hypothetical protein
VHDLKTDTPFSPEDADEQPRGWLSRHRWTVGLALAGLFGFAWYKVRRQRIERGKLSPDWLTKYEPSWPEDDLE